MQVASYILNKCNIAEIYLQLQLTWIFGWLISGEEPEVHNGPMVFLKSQSKCVEAIFMSVILTTSCDK